MIFFQCVYVNIDNLQKYNCFENNKIFKCFNSSPEEYIYFVYIYFYKIKNHLNLPDQYYKCGLVDLWHHTLFIIVGDGLLRQTVCSDSTLD